MDEQPEREASHVPAAAAAPRAGASSPLIGGGAGRVSGPESIEQLQELLGTQSYLADRGLATAVFLSALARPAAAARGRGRRRQDRGWRRRSRRVLGTQLIRLQCYEGIDAAEALYEWNYPRQLLYIRLCRARRRRRRSPRRTSSGASS